MLDDEANHGLDNILHGKFGFHQISLPLADQIYESLRGV
jgi:hypothetical protein